MPVSPSFRHVVLLVAATACWGCGTVLSKQVLDRGVAPLTLLAVELTASSLLLLLAIGLVGGRVTASPAMLKLAVLGFLNPGLSYALGLLGLVSITASMSVLLWATEPILIMLLAVLVLRERTAPATAAAVTAALVGVLLVIYRPGASGDAIGVALTVAAVAACALYAVLTRRLLLDDSSLAVVLVQQVAALCFAVVACRHRLGRRCCRARTARRPRDVGTRGNLRDGLLRLRVLVLRRRPSWRARFDRRELPAADSGIRARRRLRARRPLHRPSMGRRSPGRFWQPPALRSGTSPVPRATPGNLRTHAHRRREPAEVPSLQGRGTRAAVARDSWGTVWGGSGSGDGRTGDPPVGQPRVGLRAVALDAARLPAGSAPAGSLCWVTRLQGGGP